MPISEDQAASFVTNLRSILPDLFDQQEDAQALLADIGRGRSRQTPWRNADAFWDSELREFGRGVIPDAIPSLIRGAAQRYPGNTRLSQMMSELDSLDGLGAPDEPAEPEEQPAPDGATDKPDLPEARVVPPSRQYHTLTLIGSDRHDDFLRLVRQHIDPDAEPCYVTRSQSAVLIRDPGPQASEIEQQMSAEVRDWDAAAAVEFQAYDERPYLVPLIVVHGPDNQRFELANVPSTTLVSEIPRAVLQYYNRQGRFRATLDRIGADGSADRLDPGHTLSAAGIRGGDELRLGTDATAGAVTPVGWREGVLRVRAQIHRYASSHPGFVITETDNDDLPTRYAVKFGARGFAPPPDPDAWPLSPPLQSEHRVKIILTADFPRTPPLAVFETEIFHPNVLAAPVGNYPTGFACLGALTDSWLPDLDFGQLCQMLVDMAGYRHYETREQGREGGEGYLNVPAARWARSEAGQERIADRGGIRLSEQADQDDKEDMTSRLDIRPIDDDWDDYTDEG
jgi:hypothetical protein